MHLLHMYCTRNLFTVVIVFSVIQEHSSENVRNVTSYNFDGDFKIDTSEVNPIMISNRTSNKRDTPNQSEYSKNYLPCQVKNEVLQPIYGTSLSKKDLVQIIQIYPVLVQNVIVGKCQINYEHPNNQYPSNPSYHCRQRYSAVELYTVRDSEGSTADTDAASYQNSFIRRFNFPKEFIIVESGCEFSFNRNHLIPSHSVLNHEYEDVSKTILRSPYNPTSYDSTKVVKGSTENFDQPFQNPQNMNMNERTRETYSDGGSLNPRVSDPIIPAVENYVYDRNPQRPEDQDTASADYSVTYQNSTKGNHSAPNIPEQNSTSPLEDNSKYENKGAKKKSSTLADRIKYYCGLNPSTIACRYLFFRKYKIQD